MKSLMTSIQWFRINLQNLKIFAIFLLSVIFFMQVFHDLTWFPDELRGHWIIKRIIFASFFSLGYLFQYSYLKNRFPVTSKIALSSTILISLIWPVILSFKVSVIFLLIMGLLFLKVRRSELA